MIYKHSDLDDGAPSHSEHRMRAVFQERRHSLTPGQGRDTKGQERVEIATGFVIVFLGLS